MISKSEFMRKVKKRRPKFKEEYILLMMLSKVCCF
jgi:hypothetical protein